MECYGRRVLVVRDLRQANPTRVCDLLSANLIRLPALRGWALQPAEYGKELLGQAHTRPLFQNFKEEKISPVELGHLHLKKDGTANGTSKRLLFENK